MKPLLVLARITLMGCLWSIIFIEGVRVIMLENWRFDIFWPPHWLHAWNLWLNGWVIDTPKEWAFILLIFTFIPLWLTGWIALSLVPFEVLIFKIITSPVSLFRRLFAPIKIVTTGTPVIVKRKSYKEIRPTPRRRPIYDYDDNNNNSKPQVPQQSAAATGTPASPISQPQTVMAASYPSTTPSLKEKATTSRETFSHALFNLDDEDDDFDLDFDSFEKSDIFKADTKPAKRYEEPRKSPRFEEHDDFDDDYEEDNYRPKSRRSETEDYDDHREQRNRRDNRSDNRHDNRKDNRRDNRQDSSNRQENRRDRNRNDVKPERNNRESPQSAAPRSNNPVSEVLTQKGYTVLNAITIKNTTIDFVGISEDKICLCLIDKEVGDWLADEERFNNEEPLWFSESSHRISPVRKADLARQTLSDKLSGSDLDFEIKVYVIVQMGNIINAEDMFEVWEDMNIDVTRINRGSPKEIKLFSKTVEEAEGRVDKSQLDKLKKLLKV